MADTRQIIDYAVQDNAKEMRDALYADIHDRVMNHLGAAKQAVAQNMFAQEEEETQLEDDLGENT
jgi:hypothetical protein